MRIVSCFFVLALAPAALLYGQDASDGISSADRALVLQLGDPAFHVREQAVEELHQRGYEAEAAIAWGAEHQDREIRYRCLRLLSELQDLQNIRKLEAFIADTEGKTGATLPGWESFRKLYGEQANARTHFVEMYKAEPELLAALEKGPAAVQGQIAVRCQQLQQTMRVQGQALEFASIASLLLASGDEGVALESQASSIIYSFCYQASLRDALTEGPRKELARKLLGRWISRGSDWTAYNGLSLALQYDLPEGVSTAERLLKSGTTQSHVRQHAILTIAKLGNENHLPVLDDLLSDTTRCSGFRVNNRLFETQIRDVALAASLHLAKQDLKAFGFERLQPHAQYVFNTSSLGFEDEAARDAALAKWREYRGK